MAKDKALEKLENITNEFLDTIRLLEYQVMHFIQKTNKSTALDVRNCSRDLSSLQKKFKDISIEFYKDETNDKSDSEK